MNIQPLQSQPLTRPAATPPTADEPRWPEDSATLYIPTDGGFQPIVKVPVQSHGRYATEVAPGVHRAVTPDRRTLRVLDAQGHERFSFESPDFVQQAEYEPKSDTWFVRSSKAVHALDGAGQEIGRIEPEGMTCLGDMELLSTGDLVLAIPTGSFRDGRVLKLGADLQPKWTMETKVRAEHVLDVGNGHVAVFHDGEDLTILDAEGKVRLEEDDLKLYSATVHEGRLLFLRSRPGKYDRKSAEAVRYDSATGEIRRTKVGREAERFVPLPGGGYLLEEGEPGHPRVRVYDARGKEARDFKLPDGFLRQLHLARDGRTALAVLGDDSKRMFRLDLGEKPGFLKGLLGEEPPLIHEAADHFTPALLADGRIAVFSAQGVETMDLEGGNRQPVRTEDIPRLQVASSKCPTSFAAAESSDATPGRLDAILNGSRYQYGIQAPAGSLFVTADDCLNFALPTISSLPFTVGRAVEASHDLLKRTLFADKAETPEKQPFPGRPEWNLEFGRESMKVTGPADASQSFLPGMGGGGARNAAFSTAVPLMEGERPLVAAATSDARVQWIDVQEGREGVQAYDVGSPVQELSLEKGAVVAKTADGAFLRLEAPGVEPPEPEAPAEPAAAQGGIEVAEDVVRIGGIVITRRS